MEGDAHAARETAGQLEKFPQGPIETFNVGCYLSLLFGEVRGLTSHGPDLDYLQRTLVGRAVDQLRKAKNSGSHLSVATADTDLDPLRDQPEFRLLLLDLTMPADPFAAAR
jgi:hypothetical protein